MPIKSPKYMTIDAVIMKNAPDSRGVYALYGPDKSVIYYGRSNTNIREKILNHRSGKDVPCAESSWYFNFELSNTPKKREHELLEEYLKNRSSLPKCNQ